MARTKDQIKAQMDAEQATHSTLSGLTSPSQTADYTLWKDVFANETLIVEQIWDALRDEINANILKAAPGTPAWIKAQVLKWQYSAVVPQILQLIDYAPSYPIIDTTLQLVTRCSVKTDLNKIVNIKVNKSDPPVPLSFTEYVNLLGYMNQIMFAGVSFQIINYTSDKLYMVADVYYDGQYATNIASAVESAIETYLAAIPFDGQVKISDLQEAVMNTTGVTDIEIFTIKCRQDTIPLASATTIYDLTTGVNARVWDTVAGVIVGETTGGSTLANTITYKVAS